MKISNNKNNYYHFLRTYTRIYTHTHTRAHAHSHRKAPRSLKSARQEGPSPPTNTQTTHSGAAAGNTQHTHTHTHVFTVILLAPTSTHFHPHRLQEFDRQKLTWLWLQSIRKLIPSVSLFMLLLFSLTQLCGADAVPAWRREEKKNRLRCVWTDWHMFSDWSVFVYYQSGF